MHRTKTPQNVSQSRKRGLHASHVEAMAHPLRYSIIIIEWLTWKKKSRDIAAVFVVFVP